MLDRGLKSIGHRTIVYSRKSVFAGMIDGKRRRSAKKSSGLSGLILEILSSWSGNKRPKVWLVHHPVMGCLALLARKEKLIYICHGPWAEEAKDLGRDNIITLILYCTRKQLQALLLRKADSVFFLSRFMQRRVITSLGISQGAAEKFGLIPPIVDHFVENERKMLGMSINRIDNQIYICRRLVKRTGVKDFVRKLAISPYRKEFNIIIAGDGPEKEGIEMIITKSRLYNCKLVGFASNDDHVSYFLQSEFMVLPSLENEGFGLVIIEAINNDCLPIVSVNAGGGTEWLRGFYPELIYDGSIEGLVSCIQYARSSRATILERLKIEVALFTKEEAAKIIQIASRRVLFDQQCSPTNQQ